MNVPTSAMVAYGVQPVPFIRLRKARSQTSGGASAVCCAVVMILLSLLGCSGEQVDGGPSNPTADGASADTSTTDPGSDFQDRNRGSDSPDRANHPSTSWNPIAADEPFKPLGAIFDGFRSSEVVELSPDERILLVGTHLFDVQRRCELPYLRCSTVFEGSFSGDGQWIAVCNGRGSPPVRLFNLQEDTVQTIEDASYASFAPQGSNLALIVEEGEAIRLIDAATGEASQVIRGDLKQTQTVTFTPDGTRLVSTHYSSQPRMWDAASGKEIALPESRPRMTYAPVFSPDGRLLADASGETIYNAATWDKVAEFDLPSTANHLRFSPDGRQLWVQCRKHMCVVDVATGSVAAKTSAADNLYGAGFSRDGRQAWGVYNDRIELYGRGDHPKFEPRQQAATTPAFRLDQGRISQLVFAADSKTLVEQASDRPTILRDVATGQTRREIRPPESSSIHALAMSLAQPVLYRAGEYKHGWVELLTLPDGSPIGEIRLPEGGVTDALISDDGRYLVTKVGDGMLVLLNAASGKRLGQLQLPGVPVRALDIAPDGKELAAVVGGWQSSDQVELKQYSLPDLREKASHQLHQQSGAISYSPDGRSLAVLENYHIVIRDTATGRRTALIRGVDGDPFAYTADGRHIIAEAGRGYYDKKCLAAYDATTGLAVHFFVEGPQAEFEGAENVAISPDGRFVAASQGNGTIWWQMPDELVSARQIPSGPAKKIAGPGIIAAARIIDPLRKRHFERDSVTTILLGPDERTFHTWHWSRGRNDPAIIRRWDALTGRSIDAKREHHPAGLPSIRSADDRVWLAYHRGCDFWDADTGQVIASQSTGQVATSLACLAPDGSFAVFVAQDGSLGDRLVRHDAVDGEVRSQLIATGMPKVEAMAVSPDGKWLAVASYENVQLIDLANPTQRKAMNTQEVYTPDALQFTPDGKRLVGTRDDEALVWSTESGELLLHHKYDEIDRAMAVSPDGEAFATVAHDRDGYFIAVWELATGNLLARLVGVELGASQLRFTADGKHLLGVEGRTFFTWPLASDATQDTTAPSFGVMPEEAPTAKVLYTFETRYEIPAIRFADKGQTIAGDGTRISLNTGQLIKPHKTYQPVNYRDGPTWMAGDGIRHLFADNDTLNDSTPQVRHTPQLLIWSPDNGIYQKMGIAVANRADLRPGTISYGSYRQIVANEQFDRMVTIHTDNAAYLWAMGGVRTVPNVGDAIVSNVQKLSEAALCAEFSSTGEALLIGTPEGIELWNAANGKKVGNLEGPQGVIHLIRISPDRKVMVTFGSQGLQLWQVPTDTDSLKVSLLALLSPPDVPVTDVCFSADSQRIGVGRSDGAPRVYGVAKGQLQVHCEDVGAGTHGVAFSPDDTNLAASCSDRTIRLWRLP